VYGEEKHCNPSVQVEVRVEVGHAGLLVMFAGENRWRGLYVWTIRVQNFGETAKTSQTSDKWSLFVFIFHPKIVENRFSKEKKTIGFSSRVLLRTR